MPTSYAGGSALPAVGSAAYIAAQNAPSNSAPVYITPSTPQATVNSGGGGSTSSPVIVSSTASRATTANNVNTVNTATANLTPTPVGQSTSNAAQMAVNQANT